MSANAFAQGNAAPVTERPRDRAPVQAAAPSASYDDKVATARALLKASDPQAALAVSREAIALDDRRWEAYVTAAGAYSFQSLHDDAAGMLQVALARAPDDRKPLIRDALANARRAAAAPPSSAGVGATVSTTPARTVAPPSQAEIVLWKSIEKSNNPADFVAYLNDYPSGTYASLARSRHSALAEAVRNLTGVGQITEVQQSLQYVVFDVAPGSRVAVGDTVVVKMRGDEILEMTVQKRFGNAASATTHGRMEGLNVGAGVYGRGGSVR